jgi:hypothetical protein
MKPEAQIQPPPPVSNLEDRRGKPGHWVVRDSLPDSEGLLPDAAQLANPNNPSDLGGCAAPPRR